ncbi:hypothetical protein H5T87_08510 [bacterium]|nr:hypothetical protein [bacterium]
MERLSKEEVRKGVLIFAIILAPLACIWVFCSEIIYRSADLASNSLPLAAIIILLAIILILWLSKKLFLFSLVILLFSAIIGVLTSSLVGILLPLGLLFLLVCLRLRPLISKELALIYATIACTVGIATMGLVQFLVTTLLAPFWFATPENRWQDFWKYIPNWVAPRDPNLVKGFFLGGLNFWNGIWKTWLPFIFIWGLFIFALILAMLCFSTLFYNRWANKERLTFPMMYLPLALIGKEEGSFARGKGWLIGGALLAFSIQLVNALHFSFPYIPEIRVLPTEVASRLPPPYNGIGQLWLTFYPCVIGLSAIVPTQVLFSSWFFFFLTKFENLLATILGIRGQWAGGFSSGFPFQGEQAQGAIIGLALLALWGTRKELWESLVSAIKGKAGEDIISNRSAWLGLVLSLSFLVFFAIKMGMRPFTAVLFFSLFFLSMLSVSRLRATVGPIWNPGNDVAWIIRASFGTVGLLPSELVSMAYLRWFSFGDFRSFPMPTYLEMMRLSDSVGLKKRRLAFPIISATILCIFASLLVAFTVYYRYGAASAEIDQWRTYQGRVAFDMLSSYLKSPAKRDEGGIIAMAVGFFFFLLLQFFHTKFFWFPFHPAGYVVAQSGALEWMWCPMLIAWILKSLILRIGGMKVYRTTLPFFIGLILGDFAIAGILSILSLIFKVPLYKPFPV